MSATSDSSRPRLAIAFVFLTLLTVWPPVHMALSTATGFAPSRLGGWGMYAGPDESFTGVEMFVLTPGAELPPGVLAADSDHRADGLRFPFEVHLTVVTPEGFRLLDGSEMTGEELEALWTDVRRLQAYPGTRSAARLAAALDRLELAAEGTGEVWLFTAKPGIDMEALRTEVDLRGWRVEADGMDVQSVDEETLGRLLEPAAESEAARSGGGDGEAGR